MYGKWGGGEEVEFRFYLDFWLLLELFRVGVLKFLVLFCIWVYVGYIYKVGMYYLGGIVGFVLFVRVFVMLVFFFF